ncbi:hypothetical protein US8_00656 [Bacillus altitudinis]|nr:hypothetical protein US8_00656 [Bacillus altitudinis]
MKIIFFLIVECRKKYSYNGIYQVHRHHDTLFQINDWA